MTLNLETSRFEVLDHNGPGRRLKIKLKNKKIFQSPMLINPIEIPPFHLKFTETQKKQSISENQLNLGYLPALHNFSMFSSRSEIVDVLKSFYLNKLQNNYDIISFPVDRAHKYRSLRNYPNFINQISELLPELTWGNVYPYEDEESYRNLNSQTIILGDLSKLLDNPRKMAIYLVNAIKRFPLALKYAPAVPPRFIPLFVYLGIDLFDTIYAEVMSLSKTLLDYSGNYKFKNNDDFNKFQCHCKITSDCTVSDHILFHNKQHTNQIIQNINLAFSKGRLRDFVKQTALSSPTLTSLLRILDTEENNLLDQYTPSINREKLFITSLSDYSRPEVIRYQKFFKERFIIPDWTQLVLLLPCSAKKPYSDSKSHKKFYQSIKKGLGGNRHGVTELIITSPLGIVPRFWEKVYPAGFYDIAVTGQWIEEEKLIIEKMLVSIIPKIPPKVPIVAYLYEPELTIVKEIVKKHSDWIIEIIPLTQKVTHPDSLQLLSDKLKQLKKTNEFNVVSKQQFSLQYFRSMADYQFGPPAGNIIFPDETKIKQKFHNQFAFLDKKQLASIKRIGQIRLTIDGAYRLAEDEMYNNYSINFDENTINGSAIYTPGISNADERIRSGDDVLIFSSKGKFLGFGRSLLSGNELIMSNYGLGISIRKKYRG